MLRGTSFTGSYSKLRGLYFQNDPWQMASDREQHRFTETNLKLAEIAPSFGSILELGCGEGHQSYHLLKLTDDFWGLDVSDRAVERARARCANGNFEVSELENLDQVLGDKRFDLITACEVLYYLPDIPQAIALLQTRTDTIFVSNYLERSKKMRRHFKGSGWTQLNDISHGETIWECFVWQRKK